MFRIFKKHTDPRVRQLYNEAVRSARTPAFYQSYGVPDTLDGRFDMVVFHVVPLIDQMRDEAGKITETGQALFDTFVKDMEQNLRTIGTSDTSFPKKMKKIGQSFYGRFDAYHRGLAADEVLRDAVARNILDDGSKAPSVEAGALAAFYRASYEAAGTGDLLDGFAFPDPQAIYTAHAEEVTP